MAVLKLALLGKELSHSFSPELHRKLFDIFRSKFFIPFSECRYDLIECAQECDLAQWLKTASTNMYSGANITYPYKADAFKLSNRKIGVSNFIDSANCIRFTNN